LSIAGPSARRQRRRRIRAGSAGVLAAASALAMAAQAGAASPRNGDWELSAGNGAKASFAVGMATQQVKVGTGKHATKRTEHFLAVTDLVVDAPIRCINPPPSQLPVDVQVVRATIKISGGSFATGAIKHGNGIVVSGRFGHGRVTITYRHATRATNKYEGSPATCTTHTVKLRGKPGHRRTLANGLWLGQTALTEQAELNVAADGRALVTPPGLGANGLQQYTLQIGSDAPTDVCPYHVPSGVSLFVAADGGFGNSQWQRGDEAVVTGSFTSSNSAAGTFSNLAESCPPVTWTAKPIGR
jgi:hypothetical protein